MFFFLFSRRNCGLFLLLNDSSKWLMWDRACVCLWGWGWVRWLWGRLEILMYERGSCRRLKPKIFFFFQLRATPFDVCPKVGHTLSPLEQAGKRAVSSIQGASLTQYFSGFIMLSWAQRTVVLFVLLRLPPYQRAASALGFHYGSFAVSAVSSQLGLRHSVYHSRLLLARKNKRCWLSCILWA